jgi:glycosyltransferase involved in cell wall biosynthesis
MSSKLCIVVPTHWEARMGGSQYQAKVLIEYLLKHYDVDIAYLTTRENPKFRPDGYRIVRFSEPHGLRRFGFFFDAFRLYNALRKERPSAILQVVGCAHTGIAAFYAKLHGCRMIWRVTSDRSVEPETAPWWHVHKHIERAFLEYGIRNAQLVLVQSQYQQDQLARNMGCMHVRLLPNFHPTPADCAHRGRGETRVVWVANLKPLKNPGAFVRLARRFAYRQDVRFVMVGEAFDDEGWTREQLAAIEATPNVEYLGGRTQDEVNSMLECADLLVNTSDYEGFSNTFIQAWMRRVPVASLHVDPDGLLSRGCLGVVSHSEEQLYRHVTGLINSPEKRAEIGARARAYALAHHTESNIEEVAKLLDVPQLADTRQRPAMVGAPQLA